jgi:hypothetical protein
VKERCVGQLLSDDGGERARRRAAYRRYSKHCGGRSKEKGGDGDKIGKEVEDDRKKKRTVGMSDFENFEHVLLTST